MPFTSTSIHAGSRQAASRNFAGMPGKGELTRRAIVAHALEIAAQEGFSALTFSAVAELMQMSKTGIINSVGSMLELQVEVVREYRHRFEARVLQPARTAPAGLPRLNALFQSWLAQVTHRYAGGCLYIHRMVSGQDSQDQAMALLRDSVIEWRRQIERHVREAVNAGHLRDDCDTVQFAHEAHGIILAAHHDTRLGIDASASVRAHRSFLRLVRGCQKEP